MEDAEGEDFEDMEGSEECVSTLLPNFVGVQKPNAPGIIHVPAPPASASPEQRSQIVTHALPPLAALVEELRPLHASMLSKFKLKSFKPQELTVCDLNAATLATFFLTLQSRFLDDTYAYNSQLPSVPVNPTPQTPTMRTPTAPTTPHAPPPTPPSPPPPVYLRNPADPKSRKHNPVAHQIAELGRAGHHPLPLRAKHRRKRKRKRKKPRPRRGHKATQQQPYKAATFTLLPVPQLQLCNVKLTNTTLKEVLNKIPACKYLAALPNQCIWETLFDLKHVFGGQRAQADRDDKLRHFNQTAHTDGTCINFQYTWWQESDPVQKSWRSLEEAKQKVADLQAGNTTRGLAAAQAARAKLETEYRAAVSARDKDRLERRLPTSITLAWGSYRGSSNASVVCPSTQTTRSPPR